MDTVRYLKELRSLGKKENTLTEVRAYRQTQLLRILLRDVLELADLATVCAEQSALAEACLFTNEILGGQELTIIALGKFGGQEITYGADLDVLFVGEESRKRRKTVVDGCATRPGRRPLPCGCEASTRGRKRTAGWFAPSLQALLRNTSSAMGTAGVDARASRRWAAARCFY